MMNRMTQVVVFETVPFSLEKRPEILKMISLSENDCYLQILFMSRKISSFHLQARGLVSFFLEGTGVFPVLEHCEEIPPKDIFQRHRCNVLLHVVQFLARFPQRKAVPFCLLTLRGRIEKKDYFNVSK